MATEFEGFGPETMRFLEDLRFHNDRAWFEANKPRYEESYLGPEAWHDARDDAAFAAHWSIGGESLKRAPRGFDAEHPEIEALKLKDHVASIELEDQAVAGPELVDLAATRFAEATPYMRFLCTAVGAPY